MNACDVIGFVPAEGGYALCYDCACAAGHDPDDSDEEDGTPIFGDTEDSYTCDHCNECFGAEEEPDEPVATCKVRLTLEVEYAQDDSWDSDYAESCLKQLVGHAANRGLLGGDALTIKNYTSKVEFLDD